MDIYFLLGKLTGSVLFSLILAYCLVWIYTKLKKSPLKIKNVLIVALIIFVLSLLGNSIPNQ